MSYTTAETSAYAHMQARLITLLLRHDQHSFSRFYAERGEYEAEQDAALEPYRALGLLFLLRDELFDHILPRIVRRLSFAAPPATTIEDAPPRGRVDWERTLQASWAERPGEPPLQLHTRQRRRNFATAENLLVVATLLEYRADVQRLLWGEYSAVGAEALRHPLGEIVTRCERELAFPQFAGIRSAAQQVIEHDGLTALEEQVRERLIPGSNSAYEELLHWRDRRRETQLLQRIQRDHTDTVLGADPVRDNYLYQIWLFYELADLLRSRQLLESIETRQGRMALHFRWGEGEATCGYELRHDQRVPVPVVRWASMPLKKFAVPGVRPDFYLRRTQPAAEQIEHNGELYWREPGVLWDAKYYREREQSQAPSTPVKRMIADMALLGEQHGALLFAFLEGEQGETAANPRYQLAPADRNQTVVPDQTIAPWQLRPAINDAAGDVQATLSALLDDAHARLREVRVPACHGIFLDTLSAADQTGLRDRSGAPLSGDTADLLVCPKPHIGPWRVDLVSRTRHCCQDGQVCQIIGRAGSHPPLRPPRTAEELLKELQQVFNRSDGGRLNDEAVHAIASQVESITRRFAQIAGAYRRIEVYTHRLRDLGLEHTLDHFGAAERESLALAVFLLEQLDSISATDYSAPAIHISSVVELEVQRRIFACPGLTGDFAKPRKQTLGTLPFMRNNPHLTEGNWDTITHFVAQHWNEQIDPDDPEQHVTFDQLVTKALNRIAQLRNMAAHTHPLSRGEYGELQRLAFRGNPLRDGALNILQRAWK